MPALPCRTGDVSKKRVMRGQRTKKFPNRGNGWDREDVADFFDVYLLIIVDNLQLRHGKTGAPGHMQPVTALTGNPDKVGYAYIQNAGAH